MTSWAAFSDLWVLGVVCFCLGNGGFTYLIFLKKKNQPLYWGLINIQILYMFSAHNLLKSCVFLTETYLYYILTPWGSELALY